MSTAHAAYSVSHEPVGYTLSIGERLFPLGEVMGTEAISRPFRMTLRFVPPPEIALDPDDLLRAPTTLRVERVGAGERRIDGVITEATVEATVRGAPAVTVVVEPRFALARHRSDSRVFRDLTVPEIVVEVLAAIGVAPALRLSQPHPRRAYCVQYQEPDLDFVSRLLEEEGIFYFFLEGDRLVLADDPAAFDPLDGGPAIPFHAGSGLHGGREAITEVADDAALTAGRVTLRDFDLARPGADLTVSAPVSGAAGGPELYDFPGEYTDVAEGQRRARIRAEALACAAGGLRGATTSVRVAPGFVIEIPGAPIGAEHPWVVTEVTHAHRREGAFSTAFRARPADAPFRAPLATSAPIAPSLMTGVVTGPAGEDIHTDAMGRVKVQLPWDRRSAFDDASSDWIPVLQDNTGGSSAIPRVGWEVLVSFLEGDPDRPVVLGRLYNGADPFPETLPAGKTRTSLRSLTSPSRAGVNMIRFDDAAGTEHVHLHAERDQNIVIGHERHEDVLGNESALVVGDEAIAIGADQITTIGRDHVVRVEGSQRHAVAGRRTKEIGGGEDVSIAGDHDLSIAASHDRTIGTDDLVDASGIKDVVGGMILDNLGGQKGSSADAAMMVAVGGAFVEVAGMGKTESAQSRVELVGGVVLSAARSALSETAGQARSTTVGGLLSASGSAGLALQGGKALTVDAGATAGFTAAKKLSLAVGDSKVVLEGASIQVKAATISVVITGHGDLDSDDSHLNS